MRPDNGRDTDDHRAAFYSHVLRDAMQGALLLHGEDDERIARWAESAHLPLQVATMLLLSLGGFDGDNTYFGSERHRTIRRRVRERQGGFYVPEAW